MQLINLWETAVLYTYSNHGLQQTAWEILPCLLEKIEDTKGIPLAIWEDSIQSEWPMIRASDWQAIPMLLKQGLANEEEIYDSWTKLLRNNPLGYPSANIYQTAWEAVPALLAHNICQQENILRFWKASTVNENNDVISASAWKAFTVLSKQFEKKPRAVMAGMPFA